MLFVSLDSPVYLEILQLLHHQVINTPQQQAAEYCYFYLQVLKRASLQPEIAPQVWLTFCNLMPNENAQGFCSVSKGRWHVNVVKWMYMLIYLYISLGSINFQNCSEIIALFSLADCCNWFAFLCPLDWRSRGIFFCPVHHSVILLICLKLYSC